MKQNGIKKGSVLFIRHASVMLAVLMLLTAFSFIADANEHAEIYPPEYAFEDYWYAAYTEAASVTFGDVIPARAALLMEADSGTVLYAQDENEKLPIASVTKIMTTLLIAEAIDDGRIALTDTVTVGAEAAEMGGSQVYLEVGEQMSVDDLMKAVIVVSANDAAVAFAEHIAGSEQSFVTMMNERAAELGMANTHFANCHGLTEDDHYSSALDVAVMTRELLKHEVIFKYTSIWMDTIRNGAFGLANTNKLIRFYSGANGMKTGFTGLAKYCLSGTAKRDGMQLISVIIGAETGDIRFASAKKLLDFGFANYRVYVPEKQELGRVTVNGGSRGWIDADYTPPSILMPKGSAKEINQTVTFDAVNAPVAESDIIGTVEYFSDGTKLAAVPVYAVGSDKKLTFFGMLGKIWRSVLTIF